MIHAIVDINKTCKFQGFKEEYSRKLERERTDKPKFYKLFLISLKSIKNN